MGLMHTAHEARAAVHLFLSRLDTGEVNSAGTAFGHQFVIPEDLGDDGIAQIGDAALTVTGDDRARTTRH